MKHILTALLALVFLSASASAESTLPRLHVNGNQLQTNEGTPITLRGVSLCSLAWHDALDLIPQANDTFALNVLRLPVQTVEWNRVGKESYLRDYLDPAVKVCTDNNLYCIIDWHAVEDWTDEKVIQELEDFWSVVAPRYTNHPNILYEVFNEPTTPKSHTTKNWLQWRSQAQKWVNAIREDAPDTVLLMGSPHWSQMPSFALDHPFEDNNIAYVMHLYPHIAQRYWDMIFGNASKHVPIFISEWGWTAQEENKDVLYYSSRKKFGEPLKKYLKDKPHINWTAWSYDPKCGPAMLGGDSDMYTFVKDWLIDANN